MKNLKWAVDYGISVFFTLIFANNIFFLSYEGLDIK